MQVTPADIVSLTSTQASTSASVRVVAGDLATVPLGALLQAVVTQVTPRDATLEVNGQSLTVRPPIGLQAGAVLFVRVPNSATGTLEIAGPARAPKPDIPTVPAGSTQVKVVEVLGAPIDGRVQVRIDGQEQTATARDPLTQTPLPLVPGGRVVLEVAQTPAGPVLSPPADTAALPVAVAAAVLRAGPPPDLAGALGALRAELIALAGEPTAPGASVLPAPAREAAAELRGTIRALLPGEPRTPTAAALQALVDDGGLHFEAKLARAVGDPDASAPAPQPVAAEVKGDLKGDLLRLIHATRELAGASQLAALLPAARAALEGIEAQQATQVLAQVTGTPYILQVPFPDRDAWRTLHLSVEHEEHPGEGVEGIEGDGPRGRFRMLMHVPLTELGETWIDAGMSGSSFRAAIYLDRPDVRDRVRAALPELRAELRADGFAEVLLDVRSTADLPAKTRQQSAAMLAGRPPALSSLLDVRA